MNHIEGYQTKITARRCKDNDTNKPSTIKEINWLMDCPYEYFAKRDSMKQKAAKIRTDNLTLE